MTRTTIASDPTARHRRRGAILCLTVALVFGALVARGAVPVPARERIVVMVSVDGLAGYYLDDPKAEMPTLRALAAGGARAAAMKASTPTVTWPNHTTLVTGVTPARHGVVGNNYFDRGTGRKVTLILDPVYDKDEIVKVPTIYDLAKAAGLKTAAICWPATRNAHTLDWTIPTVAGQELLRRYTTPALWSECAQEGIELGGGDVARPGASPEGPRPNDEVATRVFNLILHEHRPNLALLHLAQVDHTEHLHGPRTPAAYAAIKAADQQVGDVWEELKRDFPGQATLLVVSDHGFSPTHRILLPNVVLRQAGLLETAGPKQTRGAVRVVAQGGCAMVYVLDEDHRAEVLARVRKAFAGANGVSKIVGVDQFKEYGVADPKDDPHAPDLLLFAEEGCVFGDTAAGALPFNEKPEPGGSHGHDPSLPDLQATFVAWGAGIKPGVRLGVISNLSVAPTIAKLLGLCIPKAEGAALTELLAN